mgnify:CR=1 FL=1
MFKYVDLDTETFKWGFWKGQSVEDVAMEDPDYLPHILSYDKLNPPLEAEEREYLESVLERVNEQ